MATPWDIPPTPEEARAAGWDAPPTAEEMGATAPEPSFMDQAGDAVNSFFGRGDPKRPTIARPGREIGQGLLKAGAFLVPGSGALSMLGSGALFGLGSTDAETVGEAAKDTAVSAGTALAGGKALQKVGGALWNAVTTPTRLGQAFTAARTTAMDPNRPVIKLLASPFTPGAAAAPVAAATQVTTEPAVGGVVKALTGGEVTPTPSAQTLLKSGVRLTRGQQNPGGPANQIEEAMTSTWPAGTTIKAQRGVGQADLQVAALNQTIPPGMEPIKIGTDFPVAVDEVAKGFSRAYGQISDVPVYPAVHGAAGGPLQGTTKTPGLVERAVDSVTRLQNSQRTAIKRDVLDVLTKLPPRKGAIGQVNASDLIEARSIIRSRAREFWEDGNAASSAAAEAYEAAEQAVTAALESQLPRALAETLRKTDAAYAKFKTVQKAIVMGKSQPGGFTARQLANAAAAGQSGVSIGTRDLGPLYDLGIAGSDVFQRVSQPTGERVITLSQAGKFMPAGMRGLLQGGAIARANRQAMSATPALLPAPRQFQLPPSSALQVPGSVPGAYVPTAQDQIRALIEAMRNAGRPGFAPAVADQESSR